MVEAQRVGALIEARALSKTFEDGTHAVEDATFAVRPGEVLALLGANGAGKTTTLHMLLGLLPPSGGSAWLAGVDVVASPQEAYRHVGYLSENVLLYGNLTAYQNLRFFARVSGVPVPEYRLQQLLTRVGLAKVQDRRVGTFSKGMRQRLGLAVALVKEPPTLVMDEPTTGLDPDGTESLLELIREARGEGRAILLSTHDLHRVPEVADRVAFMGRGRVQEVIGPYRFGEIHDLYRRHSGARAT